jgi:hypothetical protein
MGLLEDQVMPSMRDIAYVGGSGTNSNTYISSCSSWVCQELTAEQLLQTVQYVREGRIDRPSRTKSSLLGHSPPASQAGRHVGPAL